MSERAWAEMVRPIVRKCRLAVSLNLNTTFNLDGSTALADLLERLAKTLDDENIRRCEGLAPPAPVDGVK